MLAAFTACQKDEGLVSDTTAASSFTVTIPQSGVQSRAVTDAFGTGTSANRCILEIYHGDKLYDRIEKGVSAKKVTFDNLRLVSSQTYDFVFWADCAEGSEGCFTDKVYNTANLKSITEKGEFVGNSDERDAFFYHETISVNGSFTRDNITLKRPFGLLVVKTNDLNEIKDEALKPTGYEVAFKGLPTTFNALTGEVSGSADVTYTSEELAKNDGTISMDFLWATESEAALSDFSMTFLNNGTEICTNDAFTNIPIRRNYRTMVSGNLLTKKGTISVTIDPNFDPESPIEKVIAEVESAADVKAALESGATDIIVKNLANTAGNEIVIPQIYATDNDVKISLTLPETSNPVTVKYDDQASGTEGNTEAPANITITANTTGKLTIDTPESTVILNGSFGEIDATTAGNTLIVPEDVAIGKLILKKGNVKLYGTVEVIAKDASYTGTIYRCIGSQKSFDNLVADKVSEYSEILIEEAAGTIDGKAAMLTRQMTVSAPVTVSNLNIAVDYKGAYGLKLVEGATNVVMDRLTVSSTKTADRTAWIEGNKTNCTFTNSTFLVPMGTSDKSGLNLSPQTAETEMTVVLDNVLISTANERINVNKNTDYPYTDEIKNTVPSYSRGITIGQKDGTTTEIEGARVNLTIRNSAIERLYYSINVTKNWVAANVTVENSVFDGRASLNFWGQSSNQQHYTFKGSKLIGRNWFGGPTEEFATLVFNQECRNFNVTLDNCDVVSDNNPQTNTNRQYMASMRSNYRNTLAMKNGTQFREVSNPRLEHAVDFNSNAWINEITWDDTFKITGAEGATVLPSGIWSGYASSAPGKAIDGKYYIGTAEQLATWVSQKTGGDAVLVRDLDLAGKAWPVSLETKAITGNFDGGNHTISNLSCSTTLVEADGANGLAWDNKKQNAGLFGCYNGTIKNLTIDGAEIYGSRSGVLVGRLDGGTVDNCHVKNAKVTGGAQKNAAFIGFVSGPQGDVTISDCTLTDASVSPDQNPPAGDATCMAGGFIGYMQSLNGNVTVRNNTLTNVSVESGNLWDASDECASHTFIGNIINISKAKKVVTLDGNQLINCKLTAIQTGRTTEFFGFYYTTASANYPVLNPIIVNGKTIVE